MELAKIENEYLREMERLAIIEAEERGRIESAYENEKHAINKEYETRLNELVEVLYNEYEEKKRAVENETNSLDIASSGSSYSNFYYAPGVYKKTLRRRANEPLEGGEKRTRKHSPHNIVHLLTETQIAQDVRLICNYPHNASTTSGVIGVSGVEEESRQHRKVTVENNRLICDGKIFYRGQNVSVETQNYGKFPATIQVVCDKFVQFRSTMAGDTRQVMATKDDLECGRVIVRKRY